MMLRHAFSLVLVPALLAACSSDSKSSGSSAWTGPGFEPAALADLKATGLGQYMGKVQPTGSTTETGGTTYDFAKADGPECLWGDSYSASVRDKGSDNLLIYLEGGGACWPGFCNAKTTTTRGIPQAGILDDNAATTNALAGWSVVYVPYCDGSVFSGDNDFPVSGADLGPNGETVRYHHGVKNLTAALDLAKAHFPNPKRIVLAGSSAGGYGTIVGTGLVRLEYPTTPLIVFNDAGLGLHPSGATWDAIKTAWQVTKFIPANCPGCDVQTTNVIAWGLRADPTLRASGFSAYGDAVIGTVFLQMQPADFKTLLVNTTTPIHDEFPDRFKRFFVNGSEHTTLILNQTNGSIGGYYDTFDGVTIADWTRAFVDDSAAWVEHLQ